MLGTYGRSPEAAEPFIERHTQAKQHYDTAAAADIVADCTNERVIDRLVDHLLGAGKVSRIVVPHPQFDVSTRSATGIPGVGNALPFALAAMVAAELGSELDGEIIEIARPGRTKLRKFPRYLWQPCFSGEVFSDCAYILVDDVCTNGGTLSSLRSYIVRSGGTVIAATALAHRNGLDQSLRISSETLFALGQRFGIVPLDEFWLKEVGHGIKCITEGEGAGLLEWAEAELDGSAGDFALQRLGDRFAEAAAQAV
ncbi:phosphoribosyltransferase [Methylocella silvestris]|uniref:phosphoribosyltransferase n=1 Tax=Methylocella silvestris TaxID=199596 RepID=UPI0011AF368F|nr:hypothetical protein [Methylocella silvestris]